MLPSLEHLIVIDWQLDRLVGGGLRDEWPQERYRLCFSPNLALDLEWRSDNMLDNMLLSSEMI
jgi:hypothetical protein